MGQGAARSHFMLISGYTFPFSSSSSSYYTLLRRARCKALVVDVYIIPQNGFLFGRCLCHLLLYLSVHDMFLWATTATALYNVFLCILLIIIVHFYLGGRRRRSVWWRMASRINDSIGGRRRETMNRQRLACHHHAGALIDCLSCRSTLMHDVFGLTDLLIVWRDHWNFQSFVDDEMASMGWRTTIQALVGMFCIWIYVCMYVARGTALDLPI